MPSTVFQTERILRLGYTAILAVFALGASTTTTTLADDPINLVKFIVGGEDVEPGDYPYFVSMSQCGGALISPDTVLLAAHCGDKTGVQMVVGAYKNRATEGGGQSRFCQEWHPHPDHRKGASSEMDFALCKLDRPVSYNPGSFPVLNTDPLVPADGDDLEVMGFGWMDTFQTAPRVLQVVTVPKLSDDVCVEAWGTEYLEGYRSESMLCAGYWQKGERDACRGDSGGPLIRREFLGDGTTVDTHVGIVSFGKPCARADYPTVYARTSYAARWIEETMCGFGSLAEACGGGGEPEPCDGTVVRVATKTDSYPAETTWTLSSSSSSSSDTAETIAVRSFWVPNQETVSEFCLPYETCYDLTISDKYGDGFCNPSGCFGSYSIDYGGEAIIEGDPSYGLSATTNFCTPANGDFDAVPNKDDPPPAPSDAPTTVAPTRSPTTKYPTGSPTTKTPTGSPTTKTPTGSPTTKTPTGSPTTKTPTAAPTTDSPTGSPTTKSPTTAPSTSPSTSPTVSPVDDRVVDPAPTPEPSPPACVNDEDFRWKGRKCEKWLKRNGRKKCRKKKDGVPICDICRWTCGQDWAVGSCKGQLVL